MLTNPTVLVMGATGQQGGAAIAALLGGPSPAPARILALTRDASSPKAQQLAHDYRDPEVFQLVQGDMTCPSGLFDANAALPKGSIDCLFVVTVRQRPFGRIRGEDEAAIPFIDAAVAHGVRHMVYTSVDRGGEPKSWSNPTDIAHFYQKHAVEVHLRKVAAEHSGVTFTILRPTAFMENVSPGVFGRMMTAMWARALGPDTRLQMVAVRDIGRTAARALVDPASGRFRNRAIGLAGDELTLGEAREVFRRIMEAKGTQGRRAAAELPQAWGIVGWLLLWVLRDVGKMFAFFEREGYGVDIKGLREADGEMLDFEGWLRAESGWSKL